MPLPHLFALILFVILAAGATLMLALWANVPIAALAFAAMTGSVVLGTRQWL